MFPSPCGVWVVSGKVKGRLTKGSFPSPCGVWVVSWRYYYYDTDHRGFRPLAGCGLFHGANTGKNIVNSFRPLAGCGLFRLRHIQETRR